tara:strand:- start:457 stop:906 length:450 start_codon:yes stop_codon:yes gene_type:complete
MLSLLGSLLGFGTSIIPDIMGFFKEKQANKHELSMMDKVTDREVKVQNVKLQMTEITADSGEANAARQTHAKVTVKSSQWVINLSASVRPVITYAFFVELIVLTVAVFNDWITQTEYTMVWNNEMQAVWAAVVSFWFGARELRKRSGKA